MHRHKLIYHEKESTKGGISPFDKAIIEIVRNRAVYIVCPYIGVNYFDRITRLANSWRLVTDVEAWISSQDREARQNIKNVILNNSSAIHHYKDIHAKVIVSDDRAFIGSSNFTKTGITERVEMAVFIEEKEQVVELQKWFCDLWAESESVNPQDLEQYVTSIPTPEINKPKTSLPSKAIPIKASLVDVDIPDIIKSRESRNRLIDCIKKIAPDRAWIDDYFNLAKEIIEFTDLKSDDPRLVMSITRNRKIPISINQRYVLRHERGGGIGLIMPLDYGPQNYDKDGVIRAFDEGDKKYFYNTKWVQEARWLIFERTNKINFSERIKEYWKKAVLAELKRGKKSGYKKFHEPIIYEAIMNLSYRSKLFDDAFSELRGSLPHQTLFSDENITGTTCIT
jgi:Phosphatidylserine/phosphatidylglycerophosphate/cardiolipin synthases and related enzymes